MIMVACLKDFIKGGRLKVLAFRYSLVVIGLKETSQLVKNKVMVNYFKVLIKKLYMENGMTTK